MKDQLNAEITRFADLCAKVRPHWRIRPASMAGYYPCVTVADCIQYDIFYRGDCGAMIFWLLDEFHVTFSVFYDEYPTGPRTVKAWAIVGGWRTASAATSESDDAALHHVVLHQVLLAVNMILAEEAKSE